MSSLCIFVLVSYPWPWWCVFMSLPGPPVLLVLTLTMCCSVQWGCPPAPTRPPRHSTPWHRPDRQNVLTFQLWGEMNILSATFFYDYSWALLSPTPTDGLEDIPEDNSILSLQHKIVPKFKASKEFGHRVASAPSQWGATNGILVTVPFTSF